MSPPVLPVSDAPRLANTRFGLVFLKSVIKCRAQGLRTTASEAGRCKTCPGPLRATDKEEKAMPKGTVKWFNTTKGYGFIAPEDGGKDIFVHVSAVEQSGLTGLADNQPVEFDLIEGRDGRQMAGNIRKG